MVLPHRFRPLASGLRTDHPIPDLPFVDDSALPLDDPEAIEAIGRRTGGQRWGRTDLCDDDGWAAFTTDTKHDDLAWVVRWHPQHGRSVVLYTNTQGPSAYEAHRHEALLFRAGGYWWDGSAWYRPSQVVDLSRGEYVKRSAPSARSVTAADLLAAGGADAGRGRVLSLEELASGETPDRRRWIDDLALWAKRRGGDDPARCVITVTAPELAADHLLGAAELAQVAGIAHSTLRAYLARGEGEVPLPQAHPGGRSMWSRPVAEAWAEQRRRSHDGVVGTMSDREHAGMPIGIKALWESMTRALASALWHRPELRKRLAIRWRTEASATEVAHSLAWTTVASLENFLPVESLATTVQSALMWELADFQRRFLNDEHVSYPFSQSQAQMLDWLIRHYPAAARLTVADLVGDAERHLGIPAEVIGRSLQTALSMDGELDEGGYDEFLELAMPPK